MKKARRNGKPRLLTLAHRYVGLTTAVFVAVLSATGLALNHTDRLNMDSTYVQNEILLGWYGIHGPGESTSYAVDEFFVTSIEDSVFRDSISLGNFGTPLVGVVAYRDTFLLASSRSLHLYSRDWMLIERLQSVSGMPHELLAIGTTDSGQVGIKAPNGYFLAAEDLSSWIVVDALDARWSLPTTTPDALRDELNVAYRGKGLPLERVILDLHSGRILGKSGVFLVDAAAALFLILAGSGIWLWARRRSR